MKITDKKLVDICMRELMKYSETYEINIQFWPNQWSIFIAKDGVDLESFGGDPEFVLKSGLDYLDRINRRGPKT